MLDEGGNHLHDFRPKSEGSCSKNAPEEVEGWIKERKGNSIGLKDFPSKEKARNVKRPTTDLETLAHFLKGNIGIGTLAMPEAFMNVGLWVGLGATPILGLLCIYCMHLLLNCSRELCRRGKTSSLSYEETAELSFKLGPPRLQSWHRTVSKIITTFLIMTQIGFCCVYLVFISQNLYQAITCMTGNTTLTQFDYLLMLLAPISVVCCIPDLKYLAPLSMTAGVLQLTGTIFIFYYMIRDLPYVEMAVPAFGSWNGLPLYFGTAMYVFEGIGLVLPLENNMKTPKSFPGLTGVLNTGMVLVVIACTSIGFYGYLRYGDTVLGSITLNLPGDEALAQSVKLIISGATFLTYPLQLYVPLHILVPSVTDRFSKKTCKFVAEYAFRIAVMLLTFVLAAAVPNIGLFINLIGSVSSTTLALIFPPIIDTVTFWPNNGKYNWKLYKNIGIMLFGLLGFATGAFASVKDILEFFAAEDHSIELGCFI